MTISVGDRLPDAEMSVMGENGPEIVKLSDKLAGRKVVVFGLPGAFTGPCSTIHLPSFIRTAERVMPRRKVEVTDSVRAMLEALHDHATGA